MGQGRVCVGSSPWEHAPDISLPPWAPACTTALHVGHMHLMTEPTLRPMHSFLHIRRVSITGCFTIHLRDCHETYTREGLYCSTKNQPLNTQIRRHGRELFEATPGCFTEIYEHDYIHLSCEDRTIGSAHGDPRGLQCNQFRVVAKQVHCDNMDHETPEHPLLLGNASMPIQMHDMRIAINIRDITQQTSQPHMLYCIISGYDTFTVVEQELEKRFGLDSTQYHMHTEGVTILSEAMVASVFSQLGPCVIEIMIQRRGGADTDMPGRTPITASFLACPQLAGNSTVQQFYVRASPDTTQATYVTIGRVDYSTVRAQNGTATPHLPLAEYIKYTPHMYV